MSIETVSQYCRPSNQMRLLFYKCTSHRYYHQASSWHGTEIEIKKCVHTILCYERALLFLLLLLMLLLVLKTHIICETGAPPRNHQTPIKPKTAIAAATVRLICCMDIGKVCVMLIVKRCLLKTHFRNSITLSIS